ncbi:MAG: enoyl-CoA hydratase/isomerase family protein [Burkholderiaceae bacterium]|nr:enoyl-CoA hydratase/isomerase family protein [Burkholderiaceae bacterium]
MSYQTIETALNQGVALIWLNRPEKRNAIDDRMIGELSDAFESAIDDDEVRGILLAGRGEAFCAGGDLQWMKRAREFTPEEALEDSARLARLLRTIHDSPKPVVARVHGACFAGGMGLAAACDIAVAGAETRFSLSEVKLGLIPSVISPYVIRAIGPHRAQRYFLTAEVFDAAEAYRIGLVHDIAQEPELDGAINVVLGQLAMGGPKALAQAKQLIRDVGGRAIDDALVHETAARIARIRASDEAQEGIAAFFERRRASWVPQES